MRIRGIISKFEENKETKDTINTNGRFHSKQYAIIVGEEKTRYFKTVPPFYGSSRLNIQDQKVYPKPTTNMKIMVKKIQSAAAMASAYQYLG